MRTHEKSNDRGCRRWGRIWCLVTGSDGWWRYIEAGILGAYEKDALARSSKRVRSTEVQSTGSGLGKNVEKSNARKAGWEPMPAGVDGKSGVNLQRWRMGKVVQEVGGVLLSPLMCPQCLKRFFRGQGEPRRKAGPRESGGSGWCLSRLTRVDTFTMKMVHGNRRRVENCEAEVVRTARYLRWRMWNA